jgi:hypothetical protein
MTPSPVPYPLAGKREIIPILRIKVLPVFLEAWKGQGRTKQASFMPATQECVAGLREDKQHPLTLYPCHGMTPNPNQKEKTQTSQDEHIASSQQFIQQSHRSEILLAGSWV